MTVPDSAVADPRRQQLQQWLLALPGRSFDLASLQPASSDASFRRYFRVAQTAPEATSLIVMDAPPDKENSRPFVAIAALLRAGGISAPQVLESDLDQGFLLLNDLGSTTYLQALEQSRAADDFAHCNALMLDALQSLVRLQQVPANDLPPYDEARLRTELELFPQWYLQRHLGVEVDAATRQTLDAVFDVLLRNNLAQPQVLVHRDFHSRNLMLLADSGANPGVLDFQDAVLGPISYDLVSLLRDAYIAWPEDIQLDWAIRYWEAARAAELPVAADFADFYRDFEFMGVQRQLKVLGIFARLFHRDGKAQYLNDIPLVRDYVRAASGRYRELVPLARLLDRVHGVGAQAAYTF